MSNARKINETFFDTINTEEKAYFLGFLMADGCRSSTTNEVSIRLHPQDKKILTKFSKLIFNKIYLRKAKTKAHFVKKRWWCPSTELISFRICNEHMAASLLRHGLIPRKSLTLQFPNIEEGMLHHFVRGYFDGDGCLTKSDNKFGYPLYRVKIACSKPFCDELVKIIQLKLNLKSTKTEQGKIFVLTIDGARRVKVITNWLYANATCFLARKFKKYQQLLKYCRKIDKRKKNKHKYVYFLKNTNKYTACVYRNGKMKYLGCRFDTEQQAIEARAKAEAENSSILI